MGTSPKAKLRWIMGNAILFFVKWPEPGRVKTRLAATVGDEEAARIYRFLVETVCERLSADGTVIVMFDPADKRDAMVEWLTPLLPPNPQFVAQSEGDLGARLTAAFAWAFEQGFQRVAAIGSDCVDFWPDSIFLVWKRLGLFDMALGPTWDGGYYLIALKEPRLALFHEIPWSTDQTYAATVSRAEAQNLSIFTVANLPDVDTEEDWNDAQIRLNSDLVRQLKLRSKR